MPSNKKLSILAKRAIPDFIVTEFPQYVNFITSYFKYLEREVDVNRATVLEVYPGDAIPNDKWDGSYVRISVSDASTLANFRGRVLFTDTTQAMVVDVVTIDDMRVLKVEAVDGTGFVIDAEVNYADYGEYTKIAELFLTMDVDKSASEFLELHKEDFIQDFPEIMASKLPLLLKQIRTFYTTKGSKSSFEMLFALLYNAPVEITTPKVEILRCSNGNWVIPYYMKLQDADDFSNSFNDVFIVGQDSGARGYVSKFVFAEFSPEVVGTFAVGTAEWLAYVTQVSGVFTPGEVLLNSSTGEVIDTLIAYEQRPGEWEDEQGHLSGTNKIEDDTKWQDFAYVLKSTVSTAVYSSTVNRLVHPSGFVRIDEIYTEPGEPLDNIGPELNQLLWWIVFPVLVLDNFGTSEISQIRNYIVSPEQTLPNGSSLYSDVEYGREVSSAMVAYWTSNDEFDNIVIDEFDLYPTEVFPYQPDVSVEIS
jgi:hypothetical protein